MATTLAFPTADLLARLDGTDPIQLVALPPDLMSATQTAPRTDPAVFVLTETTGRAIKFTGPPVQQERVTRITLVIWVRNHGRPAKVRAEMDAVLAAIDARLAGWSPGNAFSELALVASRDEFSHGQYLVVQAAYETTWNFSAPFQA